MSKLPINWPLAAVAVVAYFGLQSFVKYQEEAIAEHALSGNISGAVLQCLPEEVDEVCTIKLVQEGVEIKIVTERHTQKHYGQPIKPPSLKYVIAMGDHK